MKTVIKNLVSVTLCKLCPWVISGYEMSQEDNMGDKPHCDDFGKTLDYRKEQKGNDKFNRRFGAPKRLKECKQKYPGKWNVILEAGE